MARPTLVDAPVYVTATKAIEYAKRIVSTFKSDSMTGEALAHTMGHDNDRSGTFIRKLSDLKRYGLIESRGDGLYATDLAKRISAWTSEDERINALREMVFNIGIFKQLYDVLQSNTAPSENEVLSQLLNITKKDRADLQSISAEIRKFYIDAMQYINVNEMRQVSQTVMDAPHSQQSTQNRQQPNSEGAITFIADKINLSLPESITNLELIKLAIENRIKELKQNEGKKGKEEPKA